MFRLHGALPHAKTAPASMHMTNVLNYVRNIAIDVPAGHQTPTAEPIKRGIASVARCRRGPDSEPYIGLTDPG